MADSQGLGIGLSYLGSLGSRRQRGQLWPMPIRETDLGHIYTDITVRPLAGSSKGWTGRALVDTAATDTFLPGNVLKKLGIKPADRHQARGSTDL